MNGQRVRPRFHRTRISLRRREMIHSVGIDLHQGRHRVRCLDDRAQPCDSFSFQTTPEGLAKLEERAARASPEGHGAQGRLHPLPPCYLYYRPRRGPCHRKSIFLPPPTPCPAGHGYRPLVEIMPFSTDSWHSRPTKAAQAASRRPALESPISASWPETASYGLPTGSQSS